MTLPNRPCPKCGSPDTTMTYRGAGAWHMVASSAGLLGIRECPLLSEEHFDRSCRRCSHTWQTTDVLKET